jgi:hypothetical protein
MLFWQTLSAELTMEKDNKKEKTYKDIISRMKQAHKRNGLQSNMDTPDTQARQDKIQDLENRSGGNGKKISWKGLR